MSKAKILSRGLHLLSGGMEVHSVRAALAGVKVKHESRMVSVTGEFEDRYIFDDGSVIIVTEHRWGFETSKPWTWKVED